MSKEENTKKLQKCKYFVQLKHRHKELENE